MTNYEPQDTVSPADLANDLVTPAQAAVYLSVAKNTLYHWIKMGYFPHYRVGNLIRIRFAELRNFLERSRGVSPDNSRAEPKQDVNMPGDEATRF